MERLRKEGRLDTKRKERLTCHSRGKEWITNIKVKKERPTCQRKERSVLNGKDDRVAKGRKGRLQLGRGRNDSIDWLTKRKEWAKRKEGTTDLLNKGGRSEWVSNRMVEEGGKEGTTSYCSVKERKELLIDYLKGQS